MSLLLTVPTEPYPAIISMKVSYIFLEYVRRDLLRFSGLV